MYFYCCFCALDNDYTQFLILLRNNYLSLGYLWSVKPSVHVRERSRFPILHDHLMLYSDPFF